MIDTLNKCVQYKLVVAAIALVLGAVGWFMLSKAQPTATIATPTQILAKLEVTPIETKALVYSPKAKKELALPRAIQDNGAKVVLTATDLPKSKHERTVTTILDTDSGEATQYIETKPLQWFSKESSGSLSAHVGFKNTTPALRIQATQDLFAVKALTLGAVASVDILQTGSADTFIGVGGRLDW